MTKRDFFAALSCCVFAICAGAQVGAPGTHLKKIDENSPAADLAKKKCICEAMKAPEDGGCLDKKLTEHGDKLKKECNMGLVTKADVLNYMNGNPVHKKADAETKKKAQDAPAFSDPWSFAGVVGFNKEVNDIMWTNHWRKKAVVMEELIHSKYHKLTRADLRFIIHGQANKDPDLKKILDVLPSYHEVDANAKVAKFLIAGGIPTNAAEKALKKAALKANKDRIKTERVALCQHTALVPPATGGGPYGDWKRNWKKRFADCKKEGDVQMAAACAELAKY